MTCPHCHRPRSECSDPGKAWYPQREVCYATMEREAANARWARLHNDQPWHDGTFTRWSEEPSDRAPYHYTHGVTIGVHETDLRPHDRFLTREAWGPDQTDEGD